MKTKLTQRRIKARKASACGLCKPWKQGGADKKTVRDLGTPPVPSNNSAPVIP